MSSNAARGLALALAIAMPTSFAEPPTALAAVPLTSRDDPRIREADYEPSAVYRLTGRVGYQIDIEFERGERYLGLAAGDVNGLSFEAQDNHVFLKPKATAVSTNLTILTDRRQYYFDYTVSPNRAAVTPASDTLYALRFRYPEEVARQAAEQDRAAKLDRALNLQVQPLNRQYSYCGSPSLKPTAAFDDGVRTVLTFPERAELPAIYVQNDDGTEALVNFTVAGNGLTVHRVVRRLILRRGLLKGCVVNEEFGGTGARLADGTVSDDVRRDTPTANP